MVDATSANSVSPIQDAVRRDLRQLREVVGRVVGSVFYGTLLKTVRESKLKGPYGHGGRGEEVFAAQLHEVLAERAGTATRRGVEEALYGRLERQQTIISKHRADGAKVRP